ncbi:hypothetical protein HAX54_025150 [Datura stramonium]|uniref:Uncharacterized protein n=1 Tax=Datura stramonium TaxID=4076 RepID=A0ABS8S6K8_DATST|nr:hypothetical protein [Datura stramonium]
MQKVGWKSVNSSVRLRFSCCEMWGHCIQHSVIRIDLHFQTAKRLVRSENHMIAGDMYQEKYQENPN